MESRTVAEDKDAKNNHVPSTPKVTQHRANSLSFMFTQTTQDAVIELEELKEYSESPPEGERRNSNYRITIHGASQTSLEEPLPEYTQPDDDSYLYMAYRFVKEGVFSFYDLHLDDSCYSTVQLKAGRLLQTAFSLYSAWSTYKNADEEMNYLKWPDSMITPLCTVAAIATFIAVQKGIGKGIQRVNTFEDRIDNLERHVKLNRNSVFAVAKTVECSRDWPQANILSKQLLIRMKKGELHIATDHDRDEHRQGCFRSRL